MTETRNTRDEGPLLSPLVVALQADRVRSQRHPRLASPPPSAGFPHRRVQPSRLGASVWGDRARPPLSLSLSQSNPGPSVGHLAAAFTGRGVPDLSPRSVCLPDSTRARGANQNQTETRRDDETGSGFPFGRFACIYNDLNLYIYSTLLLSLKLQNKDTSYKGRSIQVHSFFFSSFFRPRLFEHRPLSPNKNKETHPTTHPRVFVAEAQYAQYLPPLPLPSSRSSLTKMFLSCKTLSFRSWMAWVASSAVSNSTIPQPLLLSPLFMTSA